MNDRWPDLNSLLSRTSSEIPDMEVALVDVVRWADGRKPILKPPHNQHWQMAFHEGLVERNVDGSISPTQLGLEREQILLNGPSG